MCARRALLNAAHMQGCRTELDLIPSQGMKLVVVDADPNFIDFKDTLQVFNISDNALMRPLELILYRPQKME